MGSHYPNKKANLIFNAAIKGINNKLNPICPQLTIISISDLNTSTNSTDKTTKLSHHTKQPLYLVAQNNHSISSHKTTTPSHYTKQLLYLVAQKICTSKCKCRFKLVCYFNILFYCYRFCKVSWFINIKSFCF